MKKGLFSRLVSCILVLAMLVQTVPLNVLAQEADIHTETMDATITQEQVGPQETESTDLGNGDYVTDDAYIVNEIVENRTEFTKEFQLSNGLHMAAVYPEAVHYNNDGEWEDIDNTLRLSEDDESASYINAAGIWDIELPELLTENKAVTVTKDGYTLQFFMAGELHSDPDAEVMSESEDTSMEESLSDLQMPSDTATEPTVAETVAEEVDTTEPIATEASIVDTTETVSDTETEPATQQDDSEEDETNPSETVAIFEQETEENEAFKGTAVEETAAEEVLIQETVAETTSISGSEKAIPDEADIEEDFNEALENADKEETVPTEAFEDANNDKTPADAKNTKVETGPKSESQIIFEKAETVKGQVQAIDMSRMLESAEHPEMFSEKLRSRLKYAEVYSNTDIIYDLTSNQLKESIVISEYDPTLCGYQYSLNVGKLTPVLLDDGKIELYDEAGKELVMEMPAPYLYDDAGSYCYDITVALEENGDTYTLTYTLPQTWMADTERQWPVVLDPIVSATSSYTNIKDKNVYSKATAQYNDGVLQCGYNKSDGLGIMRFYLQYVELPELTSADVIVSAAVHLNKPYDSGTETSVEVHKVTETWDSMTMQWSDMAAFDETVEDFAISKAAGFYSWDVTDIVRGWYEGENTGMMFKNPDSVEQAKTDSWKQFISSDYGTDTTVKPALVIMFRNNNGLESYWDYTSSSAGRAGTGYVNNYTGNLVWVRDDISFGGNRMPVSISHIYNANDSQKNDFGMGYGWRTNFNQRVYHWDSENAVGDYYVWEDADGTKHYFKKESAGTYKDEDGLELTLTTTGSGTSKYSITDKYGNASYFDTKGRLTKQENNQQTKSSITVTYTTTSGKLISTITDGAGRVYTFTYNSSNLLTKISYTGTGDSEISYVNYGYSGSKLTSVTDMDDKSSSFTYTTNNLLSSAADIDGYKLSYTYNTVAAGLPNRIKTISESDGSALGGTLAFEYAQNQTKVTDIDGNVQIMQFNNFGNTVSIHDNQGRAQYAKYAISDPEESVSDTTAKGNQLRLASKLQNTVGNILDNSSFEKSTAWTATSSAVTCSATTYSSAVHGNKVLKLNRATAGSAAGVYSPSFSVGVGETYTFSAYVKTGGLSAYLEMNDGSTSVTSEVLAANSDWTRLEVSYTASAAKTVTARLMTTGSGTIYMDCVQVEKAPTASRYNLVENGDFRYATNWSATSGRTTTETSAPAPQLNPDVYKVDGSPASKTRITQTVNVKGSANDTLVLAGWAMGDSVPLDAYDSRSREFSIIATFNNTDGTTTVMDPVRFNPYVDNWQYASAPIVSKSAYSSIKIELAYDYNANTAYFDGIQLYKEEFGSSYTYDENGNVTSVIDLQKQTTTYEYDEETNDLLTEILPTGAELTYTYDSYHNVTQASTSSGVVYDFEYDKYGNNITVSIGSGTVKNLSRATYTSDGNRLATTKDPAGNITTYNYNADTNVLEWVQYPKDTEATRTEYTYDNMYRLLSAAATTDTGKVLSAEYTYAEDLLTKIVTGSTTYNFNYGNFGLRSNIKVGSQTLASYSYEDETNYLTALDYGNGHGVDYIYDQQGRVTKQTYEDGDTISYKYDNNGALATVTDSETGITTTYYYDFTSRLMKYKESGGGYSHTVEYGFDDRNNLTGLWDTINGTVYKTNYTYDDENRVTQITDGIVTEAYAYDLHGRVDERVAKHDGSAVVTDTVTYRLPSTTRTTGQVFILDCDTPNYNLNHTYIYDGNGNMLSAKIIRTDDNGTDTKKATYVYDTANQLVRENNPSANKSWVWEYDNAGNILSRTEYNYSTGTLGTALDTVNYVYGNSNWGDLLTSYDGQTISYDEIGNPTSIGGRHYTWEHGRRLASLSENGTTWTYTYNTDGMRIGRTNGTDSYTYYYNGDLLRYMSIGDTSLYFVHDPSGQPVEVTVRENGTASFYYYLVNAMGDVNAIVDKDGNVVVEYVYDAWGNILSTSGSMADTLGQMNPFRYRGYVYDSELELYYLQSRYYDPEMGRFLNADAFASTGQGLLGNNMFAYCNNNPVMGYDPKGTLTLAFAAGYDVTLGFFGVSTSFSFVIDDNWNIAVQVAYSAPTYLDPETYHTGLADAGIAISAQITDDDTVFDLEGPGCYAGFSAGAGPSFGVDMVYSGVEALNEKQADELPNGISASVGFGAGIDAHFKQTKTNTIWKGNLKEVLMRWIN